MRLCTFGDQTVVARAFQQGTRWGCAFKVGKTDIFYSATDYDAEVFCDQTFESQETAEEFALAEGLAAVRSPQTSFEQLGASRQRR
jgi:hypothetical protein